MEKAKTFLNKYWAILLICAFLLIAVIIPVSSVQTFLGHDVYFHMTRMEALAQEIKAGNIPARLYYFVYEGYGYASPMFYGDLFLTIPALMINMGISMPNAYKIFMIMCVCACLLTAYFSGRKIFKSKTGGICFAFTYAVSSYFAVDAFTRAAIGEMQAFVFVPLCFMGLDSLLNKDGKDWFYLPIGLAAVLYCHTITSVMTAAFLLVFALIHFAKIIRVPKKAVWIVLCALVFLFLSASFMFPMLEQMMSTEFLSTDGSSATAFGTMEQRAMTLRQLFSLLNLNESREFWVPNGIGYLPIALLIFRLIVLNKQDFCLGDGYFIAANGCLLLICDIFPWEMPVLQKLLGTVQFPWRIMLFATLFLALATADYALRLDKEEDKRTRNLFTVTVCLMAVLAYGSVFIPRFNLYQSYNQNGTEVNYYKGNNIGYNIGTGEYLPTGTVRTALANRGNIIKTDGDCTEFTQSLKGDILVPVTADSAGTYMDLPLIMYKGYTATFTDSEGRTTALPLSYGQNNVVRVDVSSIKTDGAVHVEYTGTAVQHISFWVSLVSVIIILAYAILAKNYPFWDKSSSSRVPKVYPAE